MSPKEKIKQLELARVDLIATATKLRDENARLKAKLNKLRKTLKERQ